MLCLKQIDYTGVTEFVWNISEVKKDQDLRLKFGYNVVDKVHLLSIKSCRNDILIRISS